jgi:FAD/FMN-containing dehydrogenase
MKVSPDRSAELSISHLRSAVKGRVITPGDPDYDAARTLFYGGFDAHPAVIVQAADANDVSYVVSLARDGKLELAIRSGGHSTAGHSTVDGGIVLDLRDMNKFDIDVDNRTAWVQPGLTAVELTREAAAHNLAVGFGDAGSVGIGGITVGGGVGFLSRKHGLTIDSLLAAEVVTADGQIRQIDANAEPDLFWAIRGGGGNFGVVTGLRFRLHEVGTIVGGMLILPATPDVIASFIAEAEAAPEELSTIANVMVAPPLPFLPQEVHGREVIFALMTYAGDVETGEKTVAPFKALATPLADMVKPMTYPEMYFPEEEGYHPTAVVRTMFVDSIDRGVAETILRYLKESDASMRVAQLRVLGGAIARVPADATAYSHRDARIMVNVAAFYDGEADKLVREKWVADFAAVLNQGDSRAYVNFVGDEGPARVRDAYSAATWTRLTEIKARYDPTNLFRVNHNIPPAA